MTNFILILLNLVTITTIGFKMHKFYLCNKQNTHLLSSNKYYTQINNFNTTSNFKDELQLINTCVSNTSTNKQILAGYDERYPINNSFDDKIATIKYNMYKYELLKKLMSDKISHIEMIKLINTNNHVFEDNLINYLNIRPQNILAGGLDKELAEFNFTKNK